jgi:tRNA(Ile2) C34 agmatinyltransferase TiaS
MRFFMEGTCPSCGRGEKAYDQNNYFACGSCDFRWDFRDGKARYRRSWEDEWHEVPEGCLGIFIEVNL